MRPVASMNRFSLAGCAFVFLAVSFLIPAARADESDLPAPSAGTDTPFKVETDWPGIVYRLINISRIFDNRLMLIMRIEGTKEAPPGGTLLGTHGPLIPIPTGNRNSPLKLMEIAPIPLSFAGAVLTDELTKNTFPQLPNKAPPGRGTFPSAVMGKIYPNRVMIFSIQFAVPPPPPAPQPGQPAPGPQTLSLLLPHAKGPIVHIPLPAKTKVD